MCLLTYSTVTGSILQRSCFKAEGHIGLIGILVWMRFIICRHLTCNRNYNKTFLNQLNDREIVRLIMAFVGRGGQGDAGQRICDEILMIQVRQICLTEMACASTCKTNSAACTLEKY
ncbi:alpha-glucan water dikinase 2-like [Durio zibethinus]|uniref:Alpha-glucan water dikinase 2-like n=1 Tax=Durio zibethinus TaxID=66656 RepID=A0A6P5XJH0_DURZI|nr:alpha-glucan water dikinase 2-like [Durio zibethinus]